MSDRAMSGDAAQRNADNIHLLKTSKKTRVVKKFTNAQLIGMEIEELHNQIMTQHDALAECVKALQQLKATGTRIPMSDSEFTKISAIV